jgi:uncharacterized membrane protein
MSSERTKEEIMKKLAIIGIAVLGLTVTLALAPAAASSGMTKAEYRALMLRSEGLNQKYGVVQVKGENFYARGFATAPDDSVPVKGENYFANGLPTSAPSTSAPTTDDFQWREVGFGVAGLVGLIGIAAGVVGRRHRLQPRTS